MLEAQARPTGDHFYRWRRRVKNHWLQVRFLNGVCNDQLAEVEVAVAALDGTLGEYHDSRLLQRAIFRLRTLSRRERTHLLVLARRYAADRRRRAVHLGVSLYGESVERDQVARLCSGQQPATSTRPSVVRPWPGAA